MTTPLAIMIASPASNSGKTFVSMALAATLKQKKYSVSLAKCGPDYIDTSYHALLADTPSTNLDPWAMSPSTLSSLLSHIHTDTLIIEAATGLFDGAIDATGSPASLAARFSIPIVLVVNVSGMGASVAALVQGFAHHNPETPLAGVVFNQVGSPRHQAILSQVPLPVPLLASLPKDPSLSLSHRHLGLTMAHENPHILAPWRDTFLRYADTDAFLQSFRPLPSLASSSHTLAPPLGQHIAIARDDAFLFTYPHFLNDWHRKGVTLSFFSPLCDETPHPDANAIFLPGGYPELHLPTLSQSHHFFQALHDAASRDIWIYGECGGFMVLGESIIDSHGSIFPMAHLLPHTTSFHTPRRHLGYRNLTLLADNPLGHTNSTFKGHCFHYSHLTSKPTPPHLFQASDALSQNPYFEGFQRGSVFGSYAHIISPCP